MSDDHEWIMLVAYRLTPNEANTLGGSIEGDKPILNDSKVLSIEGPGCVRCEQPWEDCHDEPCPGEPKGG